MDKIIILTLRLRNLSIQNFLSHTLLERKIHKKEEKTGKQNNDGRKKIVYTSQLHFNFFSLQMIHQSPIYETKLPKKWE